jgi:hypothetical protein
MGREPTPRAIGLDPGGFARRFSVAERLRNHMHAPQPDLATSERE